MGKVADGPVSTKIKVSHSQSHHTLMGDNYLKLLTLFVAFFIHDWTSMQKMIIKYNDLSTTCESKLKVVKEKEAKLKEEMTTLCKSCNAQIVKKEKIIF